MRPIRTLPWLAVLIAGLWTSCQRKATDTTQEHPEQPAAPAQSDKPVTACYAYTANGDTIQLTLQQAGSTITGDLLYQLREKDRNRGTLAGQFRGDTVLADYRFQSEGVESVREVVFLRRGDTLIEGFGPVVERNQKTVFQSLDSLSFETSLSLKKVSCPN